MDCRRKCKMQNFESERKKKVLEDNLGDNLGDLSLAVCFQYNTKGMVHERKFGMLDFTKNKNSALLKG